jgi:hypothetical protein
MHISNNYLILFDMFNKGVYTGNYDEHSVSGCGGRHRMVVGFTTTCAISAYHH